ncbi:hypothetical protein PN836_005760 [Ningiella sp. W23]|uniref:hypothetical protein n=1 Tax=Ningiella sp. W23 TaxID=3023715 RepID=UPI00375695CB
MSDIALFQIDKGFFKRQIMKASLFCYLILFVGLLFISYQVQSREQNSSTNYALTDKYWKIENSDGSLDSLEILEHQGRQSLLVKNGQKAFMKDVSFKNFVVDFYCNGQVPGFVFRKQDKNNYEYLYLRMMMSGRQDALQYVPIHNGSLPWQLYNYPKYEGFATYPRREVATIPISLEDQLVSGKVDKSLLHSLKEKGVIFSEESFIDIPEGSPAYIFDPVSNEALLFEINKEGIVFLDYKVWVRVRIEVLEDTMTIYVHDMDIPTFVVENLKRDIQAGGIGFFSNFGDLYFSDFSIQEIETANIHRTEKEERQISPNYITKWRMSEAFAKDSENYEQQVNSFLTHQDKFKKITADEDGLINVSRFYEDMEKSVIFTTTLLSDSEKEVVLNFDFADQLVILLNSKTLYEGEMNFRPPSDKGAEGRVFVEDEEITLNLMSGRNRLTFVLTGDSRQKFNWGFIAKVSELNGIAFE